MYYIQKIYINNKPLILTNSVEQYRQQFPVSKGYDLFIGAFHRNFRLAKKHLENPMSTGIIIEDIDIDTIQKELNNYFQPITAGGGVVRNPEGDVLMIYRRGKWDLPKGKLDEGEEIKDCAIREVIEETGLPEVSLGKDICQTYHIYTERKKDIIKTTYWYHMSVKDAYDLIPQAEENIVEAKWVPVEKINDYLKLSFNGIKDVLTRAEVLS
ncbi:NUDIX hydrolase [Taibaiella sp. KBW10]|uniref:NUDIX hydrolase n=1 Tax=Taibaiella sp. KBW10 TaxID=2153357 RepID=UPI000F5ADE90|nr:NUDIX domain-containing protein [Taibaiella sp. KBW10]RQO31371.1 NUDIX hydrolase [Taibaiella sp. KBW10]